MQWLRKFEQKKICDEVLGEILKGFFVTARFKDALAGTFSEI